MLRKISLAIAGTLLVSGVVAAAPFFAAQPTPTFPSSVNETGPNHPAPTVERTLPRTDATAAIWDVQTPSSVSETMPQMMGGQSHPAMMTR